MRPIPAVVIVVIICAIIFTTLAWLSGYNFDTRGTNVALAFYVFLIITILASGITYDIFKKGIK